MQKSQFQELESESENLRALNLARLIQLFPEIYRDGCLDTQTLAELLLHTPYNESDEKYGLNWPGKRRARQLALTPSTGTLRPCENDSLDWDSTRNLMIEGDNLEVLKLLQKSYSGKVNLIYIDPPYNTGNDFVYPDDFRDNIRNYLKRTGQLSEDGVKNTSNPEASGRFHTDWLNMIYPRLKLARNLLADNGVIAVSIDEHESFNLRALLDEVLGGENFIAELAISLNPKGRQLAEYFATSHESMIIYAKNIEACGLNPASSDAVDQSDFPLQDSQGSYRLLPLRNTNKKFNPQTRPNLHYPLYIEPSSGLVSVASSAGAVEVFPVFGTGAQAVWRWSKAKVERDAAELYGRPVQGRNGERWDIFQKDYLVEGRSKKLKTVWLSQDVGSTDIANTEVEALVGPVFDNPKPTALIRQLLKLMPKDALVLDFFAGSGTTGHAVMTQNQADGGQRRFILVQLPQALRAESAKQEAAIALCDKLGRPHNIAELTKERLRQAAKQISGEGDRGFKAFRLDSSNLKIWDPSSDALPQTLFESVEHVKADRTEADVLYELLLKLGLELNEAIDKKTIANKPVYAIGNGTLLICLADTLLREDIEPLALGMVELWRALEPAGAPICIVRDGAFLDDVAKVNFTAILQQSGLEIVRSL